VALKVCQIAAEAAPFAKTGGLGDVVSGLSSFLARDGHDVRAFLPFYGQIARRSDAFRPVEFVRNVQIAMGPRSYTFSLLTGQLPGSDLWIYFVDCPELFAHGGLYQGDWLDSQRFGLLTRAALDSCQRMGWGPDVVHCHDWHTALAPIYVKALYAWDRLFDRTRSVLTIHNLGFQGYVPASVVGGLGLGEHAHWLDRADLQAGSFNFMKTGIVHADFVTAVSRTYAREIQTPEHGFGLDGLLRSRADRLAGIVNGVDYGEWNPETDPHLFHHYSAGDLAGKRNCKRALLRETGLDEGTAAPVIGVVSRLTAQKGFDLCFEVLPEILSRRDVRLVALGSGEGRYEEFFAGLQARFPGKAWFYRGFNNELAHWIEAGADIFLMPSKFEPCGLNQMYSLKYGTPPIVHKTGGLADTVELVDSMAATGTGFVFSDFHPQGLRWALDYALDTYPHHSTWEKLMRNGMAKDYSWDVQGREYVELYGRLAGRG
jgi:starch synthase